MKNFPTISIVIPTKNEEANISRCLESVFNQDYPKGLLEVFVCDNQSQDKTLAIAKKFPVKTLTLDVSDPEVSKMRGFEKARGELFMYLDADIHLKGIDWFKKMVYSLLEDETIIASFTRYYSDVHSTPIENFLNLDPLQRDPVLEFFSADLDDVIVQEKQEYSLCIYQKNKIPPAGLCLYRRSKIALFLKGRRRFHELNLVADLVLAGNIKFAYVPQAGLFHHHAQDLLGLLRKRKRNVNKVYFEDNNLRTYRWFDLSSFGGFLKIIYWIILANLFFPGLVRGIYRAFKYHSMVALYEPIVNFLVTNTMLFAFLTNKKVLSIFK